MSREKYGLLCTRPCVIGVVCENPQGPLFIGVICENPQGPLFIGVICENPQGPLFIGVVCENHQGPLFIGVVCENHQGPLFIIMSCLKCVKTSMPPLVLHCLECCIKINFVVLQLANEYLRVRTEIALLIQRK